MKRETVYKLIDGERDYQDKQWAENAVDSDHPLRIGEDLALIQVYLNKALETWSKEKRPEFETMGIIRKIAGICVRSMETNMAPPRNPPKREALTANGLPQDPAPSFPPSEHPLGELKDLNLYDAPTHTIRIKYDSPAGPQYDKHMIDLTFALDPATQIGTMKFSLECAQDIVFTARARGMDIELIKI